MNNKANNAYIQNQYYDKINPIITSTGNTNNVKLLYVLFVLSKKQELYSHTKNLYIFRAQTQKWCLDLNVNVKEISLFQNPYNRATEELLCNFQLEILIMLYEILR